MSTKHTEKYKENGRWKEDVTTERSDGSSKTVTTDIQDRTLIGGDRIESITEIDSHGNSTTRNIR